MGLEGIVSKRLSASYRSGPSRHWIKVKNPDSPAMIRAGLPNGKRLTTVVAVQGIFHISAAQWRTACRSNY